MFGKCSLIFSAGLESLTEGWGPGDRMRLFLSCILKRKLNRSSCSPRLCLVGEDRHKVTEIVWGPGQAS